MSNLSITAWLFFNIDFSKQNHCQLINLIFPDKETSLFTLLDKLFYTGKMSVKKDRINLFKAPNSAWDQNGISVHPVKSVTYTYKCNHLYITCTLAPITLDLEIQER